LTFCYPGEEISWTNLTLMMREPRVHPARSLALLPTRFATVSMACLLLGVSRTRLYDHLAKLDPGILVQVGGRTVVELRRVIALMASMPRGPRKPPEPGRNRKGRAKGPSSEPEGRV
jgi:hypothetical protein